jgi:hypothetical protein
MGVVAVSLALCIKQGLSKIYEKKIPFRQTVKSNLVSVFQYGLRDLKNTIAEIIIVNFRPPPGDLQNQALRACVG